MKRFAFMAVALFLSCTASEDTLKFHQAAFVADLHDDTPIAMKRGRDIGIRNDVGHIDIPRMQEGGLDFIFFSVWIRPLYYLEADSAYEVANSIINAVENAEMEYPEKLRLVRNAAEAISTVEEGMIAGAFGMEGGYPLKNDLANLQYFYDRGVRYLAPTWNDNVPWATSAQFETTDTSMSILGLTDFGIEVVKKCNELGIMLDVSHLGEQSFWDLIEATEDPVIASHSCVWELNPVYRNLKNDQIEAIAKTDGVVFVNFYAGFLDSTFEGKNRRLRASKKAELDSLRDALWAEDREDDYWYERTKMLAPDVEKIRPPLSALVDHIDYIAKLVGVDHVGLGSDFDGISVLPKGIDDVSDLPNLTVALLKRGYSRADVQKILGGNLLRVFKKVAG